MSRVTTFSRFFPHGHPRAGEPTYFVEQILNCLYPEGFDFHFEDYLRELNPDLPEALLDEFRESLHPNINKEKLHTIRAGKGCKAGDMFSPRVWSSRPYMSKQIIFAPDQELKSVIDVEINKLWQVWFNGELCGDLHWPNQFEKLKDLSLNDGLDTTDLRSWFEKRLPFSGQIRIWSDKKLPY